MLNVSRNTCALRQKSLLERVYKCAVIAAAQSTSCTHDNVQIVIVGAGLAGLSAASHLHENGFKRTILLEATERCGGRINSALFGDTCCELGAKWVSMDASKYSMYELISQTKGLDKKIQQQAKVLYVSTTGGAPANPKQAAFIHMLFKKLCTSLELRQKLESGNVQDLNSVQAYFAAETAQLVETLFPTAEQPIAQQIFNCLIKDFGCLLGCCLDYLNIMHLSNYCDLHTNPMYVPSGLNNLLQQLLNKLQSQQIKVGKPVGKINWLPGTAEHKPTLVRCLDGSVFPADHIICTLPLGVLKQFSKHMFVPELPEAKLNAIKKLGYGNPVKIYFQYKDNINKWFSQNIRPLWTEEARKKDHLRWPQQIVEIAKLPKSERVLEIHIGGAYYGEFEKLPDHEFVDTVTKLLRQCLHNSEVPCPTDILRSSWSSSACYLGGRPYFSTESSACDVDLLSTPLGNVPKVLFAGDATILCGFGSMDGARKSGIREAERIVQFYRSGKIN